MIKSIKLKLWLILFVTLATSLGALLAITFFSVRQHFLDYATQQILERLAPLERAVVAEYEAAQSLIVFTQTPTRWNQLRDTTYRQYLSDQNRNASINASKPQDWSERESIEAQLQPKQRAFFQHLVLRDSAHNVIAGRMKEGANYIFRELTHQGDTIAYIGYIKPTVFLRSVDRLFVEQQIKAFGAMTALMILVAALVTALVSRWLVHPLSLLAKNAKQVAAGDFSVRVNYNASDELGSLCLNFNDMTSSLEKDEQLRKQWVADISHEMRTPLSVLKAQVEAMEDGIRPANAENLHLLLRNIDALSHIINDLYELSLTDLGALSLNKQQLSVSKIIHEVWTSFEDRFKKKQLQVTLNFSPEKDFFIFADKNRLHQLISNLFENSYRYTDANGEMHIHLHEDTNNVTITIEDSAPAVPENAIDNIYDRLFRVEASRNRETGGAGLGLSICKGIVNVHNGEIHASHSNLGGLKQNITLPKK